MKWPAVLLASALSLAALARVLAGQETNRSPLRVHDIEQNALDAIDAGNKDLAMAARDQLLGVQNHDSQTEVEKISAREAASYIEVLALVPEADRAELRKVDHALPDMASTKLVIAELLILEHIQSLKRFHELRLQHLGARHSKTLETRLWLDLVTVPDPEESGKRATKTIRDAEILLGESHPWVIGMISRASETFISRNNPAAKAMANTLFTRASTIYPKASPELAHAKMISAAAAIRSSPSSETLVQLESALKTLESHSEWSLDTGVGYLTLYSLHSSRAQFEEALPAGLKAIKFLRLACGEMEPGVQAVTPLLPALVQVADLRRNYQSFDEARLLLDEAKALAEKIPNPTDRLERLAPILSSFACVEIADNNFEAGLKKFDRAMNLANEHSRPDVVAYMRTGLCAVLLANSNPKAWEIAAKQLEEQLKLLEHLHSSNNPRVAWTAGQLAMCYERLDRLADAYMVYRQNHARLARLADTVLPGQSFEEMFSFTPLLQRNLSGIMRTAKDVPSAELYRFVWESKARASRLGKYCLRAADLDRPDVQELQRKLGNVKMQIQKAEASGNELRKRKLTNTQRDVERKLTLLRGRYETSPKSPEAATRQLDDQTAIIELISRDQLPGSVGADVDAFLITNDGSGLEVRQFLLKVARQNRPSSTQLIAKDSRGPLGARMRKPSGQPSQPSHQVFKLEGLEDIWQQLPGTTKQLVICPDGLTYQVPWCAQRINKKYLVERYSLRVMESARDFLTPLPLTPISPDARLLLVGDIKYQKNAFEQAPKWSRLKLGETAGELAGIAEIRSATLLQRSEANKKQVRQECEQHDILHLATHAGTWRPDTRRRLNATLLSLADGPVTGAEISSWSLKNVKLVVLSACSGASGSTQNGEGIASLERAYRLAGAKAVLANIWTVDDKVVPKFMVRFHKQLKKSRSPELALRETQMEYANRGEPEVNWAGWRISR